MVKALTLSSPFPNFPIITSLTISLRSFKDSDTFSTGAAIVLMALPTLLKLNSSASKILSGFEKLILLIIFVAPLITLVANFVKVDAIGPITFFISLTFSRKVLKNLTRGPFSTSNGDTNSAPILANAALTFDMAPVKVELAFAACSPKALSMASANISKDILPLDTMSLTSDSVLPRCVAKVAAAFMPRFDSCNRSLPITRPWPDICVKIKPTL